MAVVRGVQEQVHFPTYDAISVKAQEQLRDVESSSTLKFFVNVQGKTELETNMQAASLLPHYNTFEARAMRVVISDLPPEFPDDPIVPGGPFDVTDECGRFFTIVNGKVETTCDRAVAITASVKLGVGRLAQLFHAAKEDEDETAELNPSAEDEVTLFLPGKIKVPPDQAREIADKNGSVKFFLEDIDDLIEQLGKSAPPIEQLNPNNGSGTIIGKIVYNTVTSFIVGEKTMISDADLVLPIRRRSVFANRRFHDPRRTVAAGHLQVRRTDLHRQAAELPRRDQDSGLRHAEGNPEIIRPIQAVGGVGRLYDSRRSVSGLARILRRFIFHLPYYIRHLSLPE